MNGAVLRRRNGSCFGITLQNLGFTNLRLNIRKRPLGIANSPAEVLSLSHPNGRAFTDSSSSTPLGEGGAPDRIVPTLHRWSIQNNGLIKGSVFDHPRCKAGTKISVSPTVIYSTDDLRKGIIVHTLRTYNYRLGRKLSLT